MNIDLLMKKILSEAKVYRIPYARKETLSFLGNIVNNRNISSILEIGTGNGYSTAHLAQIQNVSEIHTFEIDPVRITLARDNLQYFDNVYLHPYDFLKYDTDRVFDLIFIDGMKRLYKDFFLHSLPMIHKDSLIVSDNLNFMDHLNTEDIQPKHRRITRKISEYIDFLKKNPSFNTEFFFDIGDGLSISSVSTP